LLRVGLTGGIASGKSHVLRGLAGRGFATLDLDRVAHEVMAPGGAAHAAVVEAFGRGILTPDGAVDRVALGGIVFRDPALRARLNEIVHPRVREEEERRARALREEGATALVTDAALLVESGRHLRFDRLVVVHCSGPEQVRRLVARDGLTEAEARERVEAQMPVAEKRRFAHLEVDTSGEIASTATLVEKAAEALKRLRDAPPSKVRPSGRRALGVLVHGPTAGPCGLGPLGLLREIVASNGLDLGSVSAALVPSRTGPWYRAPSRSGRAWGVARLAGPLALWALTRRGLDEEYLAAAAFSLSRLFGADATETADTVLLSLAALRAVVSGAAPPPPTPGTFPGLLVERWGGGEPSDAARAATEVAAEAAGDPSRARDLARAAGADPDLAGMLAGAAGGADRGDTDRDILDALRGLQALGGEAS
jgi:dephospho-CoA kinase